MAVEFLGAYQYFTEGYRDRKFLKKAEHATYPRGEYRNCKKNEFIDQVRVYRYEK